MFDFIHYKIIVGAWELANCQLVVNFWSKLYLKHNVLASWIKYFKHIFIITLDAHKLSVLLILVTTSVA